MTFGVVALLRVCHIILTVGGNNISNDYLEVAPFINRAFGGQINFSNLLASLKVGQHIVALPIGFHLLSAYLFDWNARAELLVGVGINLVKSYFLWDLVARDQKKEWRLLLLGVTLALVFSMTQAAVHFFGQACFPVSLSTLGFTVALWGIARFRNDWRGPALMLAGGVSSALSMGNVLPCWFTLIVALVLFGYRAERWRVYVIWAVGAAISIAPYLHFLVAKSDALKRPEYSFILVFIINLLGRPFANLIGYQVCRLPMAEFMGTAGLIMFALALAANFRQKQLTLPAKTALLLTIYGLSSTVMISCVRRFVAPWYGSFAIYFWIGLFGLLMSAVLSDLVLKSRTSITAADMDGDDCKEDISEKRAISFFQKRGDLLWKTACILCLASFPIMYCLSNKSWKDKHVYLITRSPASESALRNFREAPSYVESLLFQWGDGVPTNVINLARPLERYQLSSFAPDQTWSLQGDFVLPRVRVFNTAAVPVVRFLENSAADHTVPWSDFENANLYVHSPNAVSWSFSLPADVHSATLKTAFTIAWTDKKHRSVTTDGATGKIFAVVGDPLTSSNKELLQSVHSSRQGQWLPITVDLSRFKGKTVSLIFTSDGGANKEDDYSLFQFPHIDVKLRRRSLEENRILAAHDDARPLPWLPVNTDLCKDFGKTFEYKFDLPPFSNAGWRRVAQSVYAPEDIAGVSEVSSKPFSGLSYTDSKGIPLAGYSHLLISMQAPSTVYWRSLKLGITLVDGTERGFTIPLPVDAKTHVCSYDLKLCEFPAQAAIKKLVLFPVSEPGQISENGITVNSVSLAKERMPAWLRH